MNTKKKPQRERNQRMKAAVSNRKSKKQQQPHEQEHIATRMFD